MSTCTQSLRTLHTYEFKCLIQVFKCISWIKYKNTRCVTIQNFRMFLASQNTVLIFKVNKCPWASLNVYDHPYYYNTQTKQCVLHVRPVRPPKAPSSLTFTVTFADVCFHQSFSIGSSPCDYTKPESISPASRHFAPFTQSTTHPSVLWMPDIIKIWEIYSPPEQIFLKLWGFPSKQKRWNLCLSPRGNTWTRTVNKMQAQRKGEHRQFKGRCQLLKEKSQSDSIGKPEL